MPNRDTVRRLRERLQTHLLGEFENESGLDQAIEAELARMTPEESSRVLEEFAAEHGLKL
jgi:hypothetical protein